MGGRLPRIFLADLDDVKAVPLAVVRKGLADLVAAAPEERVLLRWSLWVLTQWVP